MLHYSEVLLWSWVWSFWYVSLFSKTLMWWYTYSVAFMNNTDKERTLLNYSANTLFHSLSTYLKNCNQEGIPLFHLSKRKATVSKYRSTPWKSEWPKGFTTLEISLNSSVVNILVCGTCTASFPPFQTWDGPGPPQSIP